MKKKILLFIPAAMILISAGMAAPANAAEGDISSTDGTAAALAGIDGSLKLTPADGAGLGTTDLTAATVHIPADPADGVTVAIEGVDLKIGLPGASAAEDGVPLADGTVTYTARAFSNSVIASEQGVQMLTTIAGPNAPARYEYSIDVPAGGALKEVGGGAAAVFNEDGNPVVMILPAWAKDSNGLDVPTHYAVEGDKLVQYVDHPGPGIAYPVVADPQFAWMGIVPTVKLNRSETYNMRYGSLPSKLALCGTIGGVAGIAVAGPCAVSLAVLTAKAGAFYGNGNCLQVLIGPGILGGVEYKDSYCR